MNSAPRPSPRSRPKGSGVKGTRHLYAVTPEYGDQVPRELPVQLLTCGDLNKYPALTPKPVLVSHMTTQYYNTLLDTATSPQVIASAVIATNGDEEDYCHWLRRHKWATSQRVWNSQHCESHTVICTRCGEIRTLAHE